MSTADPARQQLNIRRINLDTGRENVAIMSRRSKALRPEVFRGFSRIEVRHNSETLLATLIITDDDSLVGPGGPRPGGTSIPSIRQTRRQQGYGDARALASQRGRRSSQNSGPHADLRRDRRHRQRPCPLSLFRHGNRGLPDWLRELSDERRVAVADQCHGPGRHETRLGYADRGRQAQHRRNSGQPDIHDHRADRRGARPAQFRKPPRAPSRRRQEPPTPWRCWRASISASTR